MLDVREAHVREADALGQIMWDAIHHGPSLYSTAQRAAWMPVVPAGTGWAKRLGDQRIWVAERAGHLAGFVTLADAGYVDFAYVSPQAQGQGVFRALMTTLENAARADAEPRLWTHASLMAQPAFARLGFRVIRHETVERNGQTLDRAEMEKSLMTPEDIARLPYRRNVGVMVVNVDGHVWVGQRLDRDIGQDAWQMPQGGIDKGEDARAAALRELEEETGISADLVEVLAETDGWLPYDLPHHIVPKIWKGRFRGQEQKWFLLRFLGQDDQINIETDDPEFSAWRWMPPADLPGAIVPFKRDVYERVLDAFKAHL